jgi:hypothetical protein
MQQYKEDSSATIETLNIYFRGIYEGDVTSLKNNVYYPGTLLFGIVNKMISDIAS